MEKVNNSVYIQSVEGADLYSHMVRGSEVNGEYVGMIPYSLELIRLKKEGLNVTTVKHSERKITDDLINVKFNQKVMSGEQLIGKLEDKVEELDDGNYKGKLNEFIKVIESEKDMDKWQEVKNDELRHKLYKNGFTITDVNEETGEILSQEHYVIYKRSSSKSRKGEVLAIKESLHKEMIKWSRMGLDLKENMEIDLASLLAYESLVGSSLEKTIKINPKHILIVDDVESKFKRVANVVKSKGEYLDSVVEETEIINSLFDGESLLQSDYFNEDQSMMLLRNHMFKSAAFNCDIRKYLQDYAKDNNINFNTWKIPNMFGEDILAKNVHLIITPSSLKALKFSHIFEGEHKEKQMFNYWKGVVKADKNVFGVCKHEKKSKRGEDEEGNVLQQTSYQMINSLKMYKSNISALAQYELDYIEKLKTDDNSFIKYLEGNATNINSFMMFVELYKQNNEIVNTKIFRDFRTKEINKYVTHVKKGKLRLHGDYCVMLGNGLEFLKHAIGQFDVNDLESLSLKENEIYTTLFDFDKKLIGFRNPHTSPSNVLVAKNTYVEDIEEYFNLTDNIVCVNAVKFEIQDILSGADYDSDTVLLFDSPKLTELGERCFRKYPVCKNEVQGKKLDYKLNKEDMCKIDCALSLSQKYIGRVVNLGQEAMSYYWDQWNSGKKEKDLTGLMKKTSVMTILSGIAIDMSKKFFDIDMDKEIRNVERYIKPFARSIEKTVIKVDKKTNKEIEVIKTVVAKPLFWKYISQSGTIKNRVTAYDTPMDYLYKVMKTKKASSIEYVQFTELLVRKDKSKGDRKQEGKILTYVEKMNDKIKEVYANYSDDEEKNIAIDNLIKYYSFRMNKLNVKEETMYDLLVKMIENKSKCAIKLMNILYSTQRETFLKSFKKS
ncbi:RNA dependent RNA polymerase [Bacillus seohaeanensis]|uniref:RNA dependent RNA polymerase n=1 Tax=Bacillus seohaeanensis TaxID=284580 RepID=A0ABW5RRZ5_9BACI